LRPCLEQKNRKQRNERNRRNEGKTNVENRGMKNTGNEDKFVFGMQEPYNIQIRVTFIREITESEPEAKTHRNLARS
ncbi:unnamed protein product, partial [Urochloa humidicola]